MGEKRGSRLPKPDERQLQKAATESIAPLMESVEHCTEEAIDQWNLHFREIEKDHCSSLRNKEIRRTMQKS